MASRKKQKTKTPQVNASVEETAVNDSWRQKFMEYKHPCFYQTMLFETHDNLVNLFSSSSLVPTQSTEEKIFHLVHFLELKVIMLDYAAGQFLSPSSFIDDLWHVVILETALHDSLSHAIQGHYKKPLARIYHSTQTKGNANVDKQFKKTVTLFKDYFSEEIPLLVLPPMTPHQSSSNDNNDVIDDHDIELQGTAIEKKEKNDDSIEFVVIYPISRGREEEFNFRARPSCTTGKLHRLIASQKWVDKSLL